MTVIELITNMSKPAWARVAELKMKEFGLQQTDLLDVFDVTTTGAIGHYFNGRREPSMKGIIALAKLIKMPITELLSLESEASVNIECDDAEHLTNAIKILSRGVNLTDEELLNFFNVYEKIGAENILEAANELAKAGNDNSAQVNATLHILDLLKVKKTG